MRLLVLVLALLTAGAPALAADDVENFYRGKQLTFMDDHEIPLLFCTKPPGQFDALFNCYALVRNFPRDEKIADKLDESVHLLAARDRASASSVLVLFITLAR